MLFRALFQSNFHYFQFSLALPGVFRQDPRIQPSVREKDPGILPKEPEQDPEILPDEPKQDRRFPENIEDTTGMIAHFFQ